MITHLMISIAKRRDLSYASFRRLSAHQITVDPA